MSLHNLREAAHDHIRRNTLFPDPDLQREKQIAAAAKWQAEQAEREQHLASLVVKESEPNSDNPLVATSRFKPLPKPATSRVKQARLKLKLQLKRGQIAPPAFDPEQFNDPKE